MQAYDFLFAIKHFEHVLIIIPKLDVDGHSIERITYAGQWPLDLDRLLHFLTLF